MSDHISIILCSRCRKLYQFGASLSMILTIHCYDSTWEYPYISWKEKVFYIKLLGWLCLVAAQPFIIAIDLLWSPLIKIQSQGRQYQKMRLWLSSFPLVEACDCPVSCAHQGAALYTAKFHPLHGGTCTLLSLNLRGGNT